MKKLVNIILNLRKTGTFKHFLNSRFYLRELAILTSLINVFSIRKSRFTISHSRFKFHEFTISTSRIHDFNLNSTSCFHVLDLTIASTQTQDLIFTRLNSESSKRESMKWNSFIILHFSTL
jgi:hypothetical protein